MKLCLINIQIFQQQCKDCGYKEVVKYINGQCSKEEMIEKIKMETRRYAKRQITWFKKLEDVLWLDGQESLQKNIEIILENLNN